MNADIKGALEQIDRSYRAFVHNGKSMTKEEVRTVLEYGLNKGYKSTDELSDNEVDSVIESIKHRIVENINYRGIEILTKEDLVDDESNTLTVGRK